MSVPAVWTVFTEDPAVWTVRTSVPGFWVVRTVDPSEVLAGTGSVEELNP